VPREKIDTEAAVLIPSVGEQRFLFVIPWHGRTLIGTTDTDYKGSFDDPQAEESEIARVVESAARAFPDSRISTTDVISAFAGLRPLVAGAGDSTKDLSRKDEIIESASGLISITGGKLTTYRRMAERVVDAAARQLKPDGHNSKRGATRTIELAGGSASKYVAENVAAYFSVSVETVTHLMRFYGGSFLAVLEITRESAEYALPLIEDLPHIRAEAVYAARFEMATSVEDFLFRRTRIALLARDRGRACEDVVSNLLKREIERKGV
jgi:glycerol-3-phosphate dehydrogenase